MTATKELAARPVAPEVGAGDPDPDDDPEGEVGVEADPDADPEPDADARGVPRKVTMPLGIGPTAAEADAPIPTSPP